MIPFTFLIASVLAPIVLVTGFFAVEVIAGLRPLPPARAAGLPVRAVVVIPAHDEQAVIGRTVTDLKRETRGSVRIVVVADNCSDDTAALAHSAGAEVVVRSDPEHRGKGFALAAARAHLTKDPPDVVVVLDADCHSDGHSLDLIASNAACLLRPCQAVNLLAADLTAPLVVQISSFAFMIKNLVRQRGLQRLAHRVHLNGTGMALPWTIFANAELGGANIVEDLALGINLANSGVAPILVEGTRVWSSPASAGGTLVQRRRWEGGYLVTALRNGPSSVVRSIAAGDPKGISAALDLCIPPLALLFALNVVVFAVALAAALFGTFVWPLGVELIVGTMAAVALALAWALEGRPFVSAATLLRLPIYVAWKLPMYVGLMRRGAPKEWLRTGR